MTEKWPPLNAENEIQLEKDEEDDQIHRNKVEDEFLSCDEDEDGEPEEKSKGWFGKKNKRKSSVRASIKKADIAFTAPPEEEDMVFFHAFFD